MQLKLIHTYLNRNYIVKYSLSDSCYIVFRKNSNSIYYPVDLLIEITNIFDIKDPIAKSIINDWSFIINSKIKLSSYWLIEKPIEIIMPLIQSIAARTIAMDLVTVQPLESPKGILYLSDTTWSGNTTPNKNGRVYDKEIISEQINQLYQNQANFIINENDTQVTTNLLNLGQWSNKTYGVSSRRKID